MPVLQVHYDGWVGLPLDIRQHLGITTGDRLEVEMTDHGLLLRPAHLAKAVGRAAPKPEVAAAPPVDAPAAPQTAEVPAVKRGPGRPRKLITTGLLGNVKIGGRRRSTQA